MQTPTVSLHMIVKNEEDNLARALASVGDNVDEVHIVDTGSTDRTREVATRFGANVYDFSPLQYPGSFLLDTEDECAKFGYRVKDSYSNVLHFADFAAARQVSFDKGACEFQMWIDADDTVEHPELIRRICGDLKQRGPGAIGFLGYDYIRDDKERVHYRQWRERIMPRGLGRWINPVHEVYLTERPTMAMRYEGIKLVHHRKADRPGLPNRNYKILLRDLWRTKTAKPGSPVDPRTLFYLGQEARWLEPRRAIGFYEEYLKKSGWPEERAAANLALGSIYELGMSGLPIDEALARAERHYATAAVEMPNNPEGVFGMARVAKFRERWPDTVAYTERAFALGNPDTMLGTHQMDRLYRPHFFLNEALARMGRYEEAIASCKAGLAVCPDDPGVIGGASGMLTANLKFFEAELERRKTATMQTPQEMPTDWISFDKNEDLEAPAAINIPRDTLIIWAMQLWKQNIAAGDLVRAKALVEALPRALLDDPVIGRMAAITARRAAGGPHPIDPPVNRGEVYRVRDDKGRAHQVAPPKPTQAPVERPKADVVIFTGPAVEKWGPHSPTVSGIGGSETAAIEVARNFASLGASVIVFGNPIDATESEGVVYRPWQEFMARGGCECDVFISSRAPAIMDFAGLIQAQLKILWVHDIHVGPRSPGLERHLLHFDRILCLSNWHKKFFCDFYPTVHPDRVVVTRNGIDPQRFERTDPIRTNRLIFSSSPNRGLPRLLSMMPRIRAQVPDAELHIYYGFETWETMARMQNATAELHEIENYKAIIRSAEQSGYVKWHGRVNQRDLAYAFQSSKVWAYPTNFTETSCITAMEAQAAGCVPVVNAVAALPETVRKGVVLSENASDAEFVENILRLLTNENLRGQLAREAMDHARQNLSWAGLVLEWRELFAKLIAEVDANPLPLYRSAR